MTDRSAKSGKVILIGAGPGDPGLLTLRGREWLERADVIVYDYLANADLLRFAREGAEIVYAGKKEGHATLSQKEINALLIERARRGQTVARLKGGDPFIFGRGGEETEACTAADIPFIVVPGVSSPIGVSAYAGIPLTHRDYSSTVSIITGSNEKGKEDIHIDWEKIASRSGTLVFLMGARKLQRISENLMKYGKDPETPIAVIQWGSTFRQRTWTGTLSTIVDIAARENIKPPALTIVGEVVNLKPHTDWYETLPLFGKTIVITRPQEQSEAFMHGLLERGAEPFLFPVIETVPPEDWSPLDAAVGKLESYDGLIFTSVNGVRFFMRRLHELGKDIRELKGLRLYAIGSKTEKEVNALGIRVDVVPESYVAESLIESLGREDIQGKTFLLPRATVARETLPDELRQRGAVIDVAPAYRTVRPDTDSAELKRRLQEGRIDAVTFTSSSTVTHF
ncbi:MAG: uroporphyrinogen-III C-methyltransferase, partial [Nitrospinaceae bacterium]|nr:uroporphyrinogen-III C-methyltransferase [Nitrospinaceae bacterium]NIR57890.1 uroporphyrinogen-III C-methyltransferase [Nitrospinaceae bacterium]NIS88348.1 uroporphyrinogen-III C-methyltransferase [Nitrospinaceae bacterium]NIT85226.1 uroporphyrinogen-III C-methyltransferase [Nitrospinaceae bacterium]NIU47379.1 uroporphyrinogen-III C-methyltransferase [Nitrospinaceae bacterium]